MVATKEYPAPKFEAAYRRAEGYQVSTPYGTVTITDDGRRVAFELYPDVRQSIHHKALFSYYQQLARRGINQINIDHLDLHGLDKSINLKRGKARLDMAYIHRGKIHEIELKTHREVGLDVSARQIVELARHCENLTLVVPRRDMEDMHTILTMLELDKQVLIDSYEILEDEGEEDEG